MGLQNLPPTTKMNEHFVAYEMLPLRLQEFIDLKAVGGYITDENNEIRKLTVDQLCKRHGVTRQAVYKQIKHIPNFWDLVMERRKNLNKKQRLSNMHSKWYIHALTFKNWAVTEAWFINNDENYIKPSEKREVELGDNLAALLASEEAEKIIEGEVIEHATEQSTESNSSSQVIPEISAEQ